MMVNTERAQPLVLDEHLSALAQDRAEYLCEKGQWSHDGWLESFRGHPRGYFGENLAKGFRDATSTHQALMNSPGHRANIVNPHYEIIGLGQECGITVELFEGKLK